MTTASRTIRSSPYRDVGETWNVIVALLAGNNYDARAELSAVAGTACSLIADRVPETAPIVVTCDGPRTRIYCTYDEKAVDGTDAREESFVFDPLKGDWRVSLPCPKDELGWVTSALAKHSTRISARDMNSDVVAKESTSANQALALDVGEFFSL